MPIKRIIETPNVNAFVYTDEIEESALEQLYNTASLPIVTGHIAVMPDVHYGIGATVGSVVPTKAAIIPAAVGVDIGCGMLAVRLSITAEDLPDSLAQIRSDIEAVVPVGFSQHQTSVLYNDSYDFSMPDSIFSRLDSILAKHPSIISKRQHASFWLNQLGTLGGGNHFIELCLDEEGYVWIMLHSGSRGIGNTIGTYFIEKAKEHIASLGHIKLTDENLAWLDEGTEIFDDYVKALHWAQYYASENRVCMLELIHRVIIKYFPRANFITYVINCHHNYVAKETHGFGEVYITRKGAIRAGLNELGIIPGSMGAKSFIVRGLGNEKSLLSCSHGAGRRMSRGQAKRAFTVADLEGQTQGVECRKDEGVLDEIPGAYKDIDTVMANQSDLVEIVHTLKQVMCIKG
jgi:tRNA-splicing ligase RtcB